MIIYIEIHPYACGINRIRLEFKAASFLASHNHRVQVLIESDWNLKLKACLRLFLHTSINRIRLEFKGTKRIICGQAKKVLIESDWNLKIHTITTSPGHFGRINRIRLEFKEHCN